MTRRSSLLLRFPYLVSKLVELGFCFVTSALVVGSFRHGGDLFLFTLREPEQTSK